MCACWLCCRTHAGAHARGSAPLSLLLPHLQLHGHHTDAPVTADEVAACQSHNSVLLQAGDLRLHNMKLDFCK